jgi:hypothetical protein
VRFFYFLVSFEVRSSLVNYVKDKEKDRNLIGALFEPDIYRFGDDKDNDQENVEDYDI